MTHLSFEEINEIADRRDAALTGHVAECDECRETLRRVRDLVAAAHALPKDIAPPPEVWSALQTRVSGRAPRRSSRMWRYGAWMATAATIVFIAGVALLLPSRAQKVKGAKVVPTQPSAAPAMYANVERSYVATVSELRIALEAQRTTLAPATVRVLERSLAAIDTAIAEARAALASDPSNRMLLGILSANYERKVELLQRATELSPRS
jgi:hypothetical protein